MRLCCVLFSWFPHGGLQQDVLKIARACSVYAEVSIVCMRWDGPLPAASADGAGIEVRELPARGWTRTAQRAAFVAQVQTLRADFDLLLGFNRMPGLDYYFAADSCFARKALQARPWWYRLAPRTRQYLAWERAVFGPDSRCRTLLLSPQQWQEYRACYDTPAARLQMLPPGIRRAFMAPAVAGPERARVRAELGLAADALLVLQVGSGFRVKGVERALRALAALPPALQQRVHYVQIGRGKAAPWQRLAQQLRLQRVSFLGGRDDVLPFMRAADLLLHPSVQESAGMVLLEALVAGLPVLCTASCGYAFHVVAAGAGLVCPEPFRQESLDHLLQQMLQADRSAWQQAGIAYGRREALYDLPEAVARIVCADDGAGEQATMATGAGA